MTAIKTYMRAALALLLGERCVVCGSPQVGARLCPACILRLPYINIKGAVGNPIERLFWGKTPVSRASAMLTYRPGFEADALLHAIKYHNRPDLATDMGRMMAQELLPHGFFEGIDAIMPIPLHPRRQRQRGYNQSEQLARGIAEVCGLPIVQLARRTKDNISQTSLSHAERAANVAEIFEPDTALLSRYSGRHILIVDDVITTGATTISCTQALDGADLTFSFLALAYAGQLHLGRLSCDELHRPDCTISNEDFRERQRRSLS